MRLAYVAISIVAVSTTTCAASANPTPADLCLNQMVRKTAAELVGTWAQGYAFAKVIIGTDGKFGDVLEPSVKETGKGYVVCHSSYNLVRPGGNGMGYVVHISDFDFRVTEAGSSYNISLENLPTQTDGSEAETRALLSRFTINDRPYLEILDENQARLARRGN
jgi:hypothetical protein